MMYEYKTKVDFSLNPNKNGWYTNKDAVENMIQNFNKEPYSAPVVIERESEADKVIGLISTNGKIETVKLTDSVYTVEIPLMLQADFQTEKFLQAVDLDEVELNPDNPEELISFRIKNIIAIPKEDNNYEL